MNIDLRPARPEDAEEMAGWFADLARLAEWGGPEVTFPLTAGQLAAWIAEAANERPRICFTAVDESGVPIGHVQFLRDPPRRWARLGRFGVAPALRGRGFGRRLFGTAMRMAFVELDVEHLVLAVAVRNEPARRLYLSCGFRDEGAVTVSRTGDGLEYPMQLMGLERSGWDQSAGAALGATKVA